MEMQPALFKYRRSWFCYCAISFMEMTSSPNMRFFFRIQYIHVKNVTLCKKGSGIPDCGAALLSQGRKYLPNEWSTAECSVLIRRERLVKTDIGLHLSIQSWKGLFYNPFTQNITETAEIENRFSQPDHTKNKRKHSIRFVPSEVLLC